MAIHLQANKSEKLNFDIEIPEDFKNLIELLLKY